LTKNELCSIITKLIQEVIPMNLRRGLSGNTLKLLAAAFMIIDHIGVILVPSSLFLRSVGRLAFPIFAFLISEGAKYTGNKLRYLLSVFSVAAVCQLVYAVVSNGDMYFNVFVTFTISILLIYLCDWVKTVLFNKESSAALRIAATCSFIAALLLTAIICHTVTVDYGFIGCIMPLLAYLPVFDAERMPELHKKYDKLIIRLCYFTLGVIILAVQTGTIQYYSLFSIPLLLMYNGQRGRLKLKYFFYLFYPAHLAILYGIGILITILK